MTHESNRTLVLVIVALVALLIGCCLGAVFGATAASLIGVRTIERTSFVPPVERVVPIPEGMPEMPGLPEDPTRPDGPARGRSGAYVRDVASGSPADEAGIQPGDLITRVDDVAIDRTHSLTDLIGARRPGERVTLTVERESGTERIEVRLDENPETPNKPYLGVWVMELQGND